MNNSMSPLRKCYYGYVRAVNWLRCPFLLALRVYFGWKLFYDHGLTKLMNLDATTEQFAGWHIPAPHLSAVLAGLTETCCGALLMVGFATRIIAIPLIVLFVVAYFTAHVDQVHSIYDFTKAPPFLFLLTSVIVWLFGAGGLSIDGAIACCKRCNGAPDEKPPPPA